MQQPTVEQRHHWTKTWLADRDRARRDLFWLANEVLSPADSRIMVHHAHDVIVDHCQQFQGWTEIADPMKLSKWGFPLVVQAKPRCSLWDNAGDRDNLLLVSRGHLKTTIHTVAHSIQWIINYPDIRILIVTATDEKAQMMVSEIKQHFQFNAIFRFLFPEFCPDARKVSDWGSKTEFTVPNRHRRSKEPTVMTASVGKALASTHHDVIKASDVVTENNVRTDGQIKEVKDFFGYLEPLRERGESKNGRPNPGWKDVEGTIYHFADYYQMILDSEGSKPKDRKAWRVTKQSCWIDDAKTKPLWPERFPVAELHRIENSPEVGPVLFASQYELNPIVASDGLAALDQIKFFPAKIAYELMPRYRVHTTVDLAGMEKTSTGDFSVISTCGFDRDGRIDVLSILRGHFTDEEIIDRLFAIQQVYPSNIDFKIQKDHFSATLKGYLHREQAKRGIWLNIIYTQTSGRGSKSYRIIKGLQGWFRQGIIRFADDISCKNELILEILRFPKGKHDDILDTLADQFMNRDGDPVGDVYPDGARPVPFGGKVSDNRFLEFDPISKDAKWLHDQIESAHSEYHQMTGGL